MYGNLSELSSFLGIAKCHFGLSCTFLIEAFYAVIPPSTGRVMPVMFDAWSLNRNTTGFTISSTSVTVAKEKNIDINEFYLAYFCSLRLS